MFESLSNRLSSIFDKLKGRGSLSEGDVTEALREIRIALLEADVALPVVRQFINEVKEKAVGQDVLKSITPGQMVVKIVYDHLVDMLSGQENTPQEWVVETPVNLNAPAPVVILMVGLQGAGKTTFTAKLAHFLKSKNNKKILMASLDIYRPAAREQLKILGEQHSIETLSIDTSASVDQITNQALSHAKQKGFDVLLLDSAGRLHIDDDLMNEMEVVKKIARPTEIFLVADAMTGQDAVTIAQTFHERLVLTGIVLTRMDGDGRGGAALSMRTMTGCPIKFLGVGEKVTELEVFQPHRVADRIFDRGDIVKLVEKASEIASQEDAEKLAKKMAKGQFDLYDMEKQLLQMQKLGGVQGLLSMLPGMGKIKEQIETLKGGDKMVNRQIAMIRSMTPKERRDVKILNASRKRRIAAGAGVQVADLNRFLKQYQQMQDMFKKMGRLNQKGMLKQSFSGIKNLFNRS